MDCYCYLTPIQDFVERRENTLMKEDSIFFFDGPIEHGERESSTVPFQQKTSANCIRLIQQLSLMYSLGTRRPRREAGLWICLSWTRKVIEIVPHQKST